VGRASKTGWRQTTSPRRPIDLAGRYLPHQYEVFHRPERQVVYVKGRRAGGTYGAVLRVIELAREEPRSRHLWVDHIQRHITRYVRRYFAPLLRGTRWRWDAAALVLRFESGATCDFGSAQRPELLEGFGYDYLWINEAGHLLRNENLYFETLLPMVMETPQAQIFLVGAPKGGGLFQRMYEWGQDAERGDWASFRHTSMENPHVSAEWLARMQRVMPDRVWRQEILAEFVDDEGAVFRDVERRADVAPEPAPQPGAPYVIGVDLGRYQDFTAAWVGRADTGCAVACERFRRMPWPQQQARLAALARSYGEPPLVVDAGGVGDPLCDALEDEGFSVIRVRFTNDSKRVLVERLAVALERGTLRFVPDEQTLRELRAFHYEFTPAGHVRTGGYREHDDCVIALALCCHGMARRGARDFILGAPMRIRDLD
jgi:phage terminase large subunit-like protein